MLQSPQAPSTDLSGFYQKLLGEDWEEQLQQINSQEVENVFAGELLLAAAAVGIAAGCCCCCCLDCCCCYGVRTHRVLLVLSLCLRQETVEAAGTARTWLGSSSQPLGRTTRASFDSEFGEETLTPTRTSGDSLALAPMVLLPLLSLLLLLLLLLTAARLPTSHQAS